MPSVSGFVPASASVSRTLAEQAAAELYDGIMTGAIAPGSILRLNEVATSLGMSLSPVREGLRRLESMGLVAVESHKGARVREVSVEDFEDSQKTRALVEVAAIRLAARNFTAEDAAAARAALEAHERAVREGNGVVARREHTLFHFALYRAGRSAWLLRAIEPVWENSERYRFSPLSDPAHAESQAEHAAILAACEAGDEDAAAAALQAHIDAAAERMRASLHTRLHAHDAGTPPAD